MRNVVQEDSAAQGNKNTFPPEYETAKVSIQEVTKSNDRMLSGLTILREGENFSPTVYLEPFTEQVAQGRSLEDTLREITKIQTVHHAHIPVNISTFMDYAETGGTERTIRRYLYGRDHGNVPGTGKRTYCTGGTICQTVPGR